MLQCLKSILASDQLMLENSDLRRVVLFHCGFTLYFPEAPGSSCLICHLQSLFIKGLFMSLVHFPTGFCLLRVLTFKSRFCTADTSCSLAQKYLQIYLPIFSPGLQLTFSSLEYVMLIYTCVLNLSLYNLYFPFFHHFPLPFCKNTCLPVVFLHGQIIFNKTLPFDL